MKQILFVVDMQNDFLVPNGKLSLSPKDKDTTSNLRQKIAAYIKNFEGHVVVTRDTHQEGSCEFKAFPPHCLEGTPGWEVVDEIKTALESRTAFVEGSLTITDDSYEYVNKSSFTSPLLEPLYEVVGYESSEVHVVGVCTHICVHDITASLVNFVKETYGRLPTVIIHKDMVGDFNNEMAEFALKRLQNLYGVEVV